MSDNPYTLGEVWIGELRPTPEALANAEKRCDDMKARLLVVENELVALRMALRDALVLAEEGWSYAGGYFRDKWEVKLRAERISAVLAGAAP